MNPTESASREFLRHAVATLAYRGGKAFQDAPPGFPEFRASPNSRTPGEVLAHLCDLFEWALHLCRGQHIWRESGPGAWDRDVKRFFGELALFDEFLASGEPLGVPAEKLFQGPVADALTHVGQIAMLRRAAGKPVRGENYFKADIRAGIVGQEQTAPRVEFE
jgi:hypothetical protein